MLYKKEHGFTLIELLIVVLLISALSAISISIISPSASEGRGRDGVRLNTVKNLAEAIESYRQIEGEYPLDGDPINEDSLLRQTYIKGWPKPLADDGSEDPTNWSYAYSQQGVDGFTLFSPNSRGGCYKYQTDWRGMMYCPVSECTIALSFDSDCSDL